MASATPADAAEVDSYIDNYFAPNEPVGAGDQPRTDVWFYNKASGFEDFWVEVLYIGPGGATYSKGASTGTVSPGGNLVDVRPLISASAPTGTYRTEAKLYTQQGGQLLDYQAFQGSDWEFEVVAPPTFRPEVSKVSPTQEPVPIDEGNTAPFTAKCTDQDGDAVQMNWKMFDGNGVQWEDDVLTFGSTGSTQKTWTPGSFQNPGDSGRVEVRCTDSEGQDSVWRSWSVSVVAEPPPNDPPACIRFAPTDRQVQVAAGASVELKAECNDADGNMQDGQGRWWVDNTAGPLEHTETGDSVLEAVEFPWSGGVDWPAAPTSGGPYTVQFRQGDKSGATAHPPAEWIVTFNAPPPPEQHDPTASRNSPSSSSVTVNEGQGLTFKANVHDDDCDLNYAEWYLDGVYKETDSSPDGCDSASTWQNTFPSTGVFEVTVIVYDDRNDGSHVGSTTWTVTVNSVPERMIPQNQPLVLVHGWKGSGGAHHDLNDYFDTTINFFSNPPGEPVGWPEDKIHVASYYTCNEGQVPNIIEVFDGATHSHETHNIFHARDNSNKPFLHTLSTNDNHATPGCDSTHTQAIDRETSIEHVAYHWAQAMFVEFGSECFSVVAHSMGGLVVRYALAQVDAGHSGFPDSLCVDKVVTFGTPHGGSHWADEFTFTCDSSESDNDNRQCNQMRIDSYFLQQLRDNYQNPPQTRWRSHWLVVGSEGDSIVNGELGIDMNAHHAFVYAEGEGVTHRTDLGTGQSYHHHVGETYDARGSWGGEATVREGNPWPLFMALDFLSGALQDPNPGLVDRDGDGIADDQDPDDDNDGQTDADELACNGYPLHAVRGAPDADGDDSPDCVDLDDDNDGTPDATDAFPLDPNEDTDTDNDGIGNNVDPDDDGDGTPDTQDAFPLDASEDKDTDGDGIGNNADLDDDGDGTSDEAESARGTNPLDPDTDHDGIGDREDTFPLDSSEWNDTDNDGVGDNADTDDDGDGQSDAHEAACGSNPLDANDYAPDQDADNTPDCVDLDRDGDGHLNDSDAFPSDPTEWSDTDLDGWGDNQDVCPDVPDASQEDRDADGQGDACDSFPEDPTRWQDTDAPAIALSVEPAHAMVGDTVWINGTVTDEASVQSVVVESKRGSHVDNRTILAGASDTHELSFSVPITNATYGRHLIVVTAHDAAGNVAREQGHYVVARQFQARHQVQHGATETVLDRPGLVVLQYTANETFNATVDIDTVLTEDPSTFGINAAPAVGQGQSFQWKRCIRVEPVASHNAALINRINLTLPYTDEDAVGFVESGFALYYFDGQNWHNTRDYVGRTIPNGGPFVFSAGVDVHGNYAYAVVNHTSTYGLGGLMETDPPVIKAHTPAVTTTSTRPTIEATLHDGGSGIDPGNTTMTLDGVNVAATVTTTSISFEPASDLALGPHVANVTAQDVLGNSATLEWTFTITLPPSSGGGRGDPPGPTLELEAGPTAPTLPGAVAAYAKTVYTHDDTKRVNVSFPDDSPIESLSFASEGKGRLRIHVDLVPDLANGLLSALPAFRLTGPVVDVTVHVEAGQVSTSNYTLVFPPGPETDGAGARQLVVLHESGASWEVLESQLVNLSDGRTGIRSMSTSLSPFAVAVDEQSPLLDDPHPNPGSVFNQSVDQLSINWTDNRGIDPSTASLFLEGLPVPVLANSHGLVAHLSKPLGDGRYDVEVRVADESGLWTEHAWSFEVNLTEAETIHTSPSTPPKERESLPWAWFAWRGALAFMAVVAVYLIGRTGIARGRARWVDEASKEFSRRVDTLGSAISTWVSSAARKWMKRARNFASNLLDLIGREPRSPARNEGVISEEADSGSGDSNHQ